MDIQFIKLSDNVRLGEGEVYQMVESTVYFEAYRHILEGLKEVQPHQLPLQVTYDHLIKYLIIIMVSYAVVQDLYVKHEDQRKKNELTISQLPVAILFINQSLFFKHFSPYSGNSCHLSFIS